jgi:hypothetical protein
MKYILGLPDTPAWAITDFRSCETDHMRALGDISNVKEDHDIVWIFDPAKDPAIRNTCRLWPEE